MRAIVSVSDTTGLIAFIERLVETGVEVFSTGQTSEILVQANLPARSIAELDGVLELARQMAEPRTDRVDIVVVNLPPFPGKAAGAPGCAEDVLGGIDIDGAALLRASAKSFAEVLVLVDPNDYQPVLDELSRGEVSLDTRRNLAAKAFQHTAAYDTFVASYLRSSDDLFPSQLTVVMNKVAEMAHGENEEQRAAFYYDGLLAGSRSTMAGAVQLAGKGRSFVDTLDADVALQCVRQFSSAAVAVVKHGTPCGLACGDDLVETYRRAHAGDPSSTPGSAIALNRVVDLRMAQAIVGTFFEDIVAPGYDEDSLELLRRAEDLRVFQVDMDPSARGESCGKMSDLDVKRVSGGYLLQTNLESLPINLNLQVVSEREPTLEELTNLVFAWRAVRQVKSAGTVLAARHSLVGVGAGQLNRADSLQMALSKAGSRSLGSVMASDGFLSKADVVEMAASRGVSAIIQPGGSGRDEEILRAVNRRHMAMVFTGVRQFSH